MNFGQTKGNPNPMACSRKGPGCAFWWRKLTCRKVLSDEFDKDSKFHPFMHSSCQEFGSWEFYSLILPALNLTRVAGQVKWSGADTEENDQKTSQNQPTYIIYPKVAESYCGRRSASILKRGNKIQRQENTTRAIFLEKKTSSPSSLQQSNLAGLPGKDTVDSAEEKCHQTTLLHECSNSTLWDLTSLSSPEKEDPKPAPAGCVQIGIKTLKDLSLETIP